MDTNDVMMIYDNDDHKGNEINGQYNGNKSPSISNTASSGIQIACGDSDDENDEVAHTEGIYDDLDDVLNEYLSEDEVYGGGEDEVSQESQLVQNANTYSKSKNNLSLDKIQSSNSIEHTEKDVDEVIVNSHLQEIVDIKKEIRELQDMLHEKSVASGDKVKIQDVEDENAVINVKLKDTVPSLNHRLKRVLLSRVHSKKKPEKMELNSLLKRTANKNLFSGERSEDRVVSSSVDKKRRTKRNEMEEESSGLSGITGSQIFQKKKILNEFSKVRTEKKNKSGTEEVIPVDTVDSKMQEIENIPPSVTVSLRKILQMTAHTPEEKYKVLDARDKLYKIMRDKDPSLKTGALVGNCPDMCPEKERLQREFQYQVSIFEMINYPKNTNLNHSTALKQYCRSSADQEEPLPHELRPVNVLKMTMSYLLHNIADHCELSDDNLGEWYMFMWDRTRAIRKELTQQGVCNLDTVELVEQCARFHIHCAERLADQDSSVYDDKINTENLTKCLQTLKYMYKDLAKEDIYCSNEPEFLCYSLLLNLNNASVFTELSDMSERLMSSTAVRFALDVMSAWERRNYVRFFNLVKRTTYLNCCILRRYFNEMRLYATKTMIRSYCTKSYSPQIPVCRFVDNLAFEGVEECCKFFTHCNFDVNPSFVYFNRLAFRNPETSFPFGRSYATIEEKKKRPFSVVMAGGELPPRIFDNHEPQNSFLQSGELKLDSLLSKELLEFLNSSTVPTTSVKTKLTETKSDSMKHSKEPVPLFSDIFSKSHRHGTDIKDMESEDKKSQSKSLFSKSNNKQANIFGASGNIFGQNSGVSEILNTHFKVGETGSKSLFGSSDTNIFSGTNFSKKNIFNLETNIFDSNTLPFKKGPESSNLLFNVENESEPVSDVPFKFHLPTPPPQEDLNGNEKKLKSVLKVASKPEIEKAEELTGGQKEKIKKEGEDLHNKCLNTIKNANEKGEKREREEREAVEKEKKEVEMKRKEEIERQKKFREAEFQRLEEKAKMEEMQRKSKADMKLKVDSKMLCLKQKYVQWKTREFFNKWRLKTWIIIENRKVKEYFKEVHIRYPPVCTEEDLNGNPYGLIIPNLLILRKCQNYAKEDTKPNSQCKRLSLEDFPCINVEEIIAKELEIRAKRLFNKADPFLWKVIFSVPDDRESRNWKDIETFIEMNFVDKYSWRFCEENKPLYLHEGCHSTFRYKISVRLVRGTTLYEGKEANLAAVIGSNSIIFVVSEDCNSAITKQRLKSLLSARSPLPQVPLIIYSLGEKFTVDEIEKSLDLRLWQRTHISEYHVECCLGWTKEELISHLITCLKIAAEKSAPVTPLRIVEMAEFSGINWFECIWRRIETSLSNYRVILIDPKIIIECYNACVNELRKIFLDSENEQYTLIGDEFLQKRLKRPTLTSQYCDKLLGLLELLKLPNWPREIPKSSHQLKHRIHQYCVKVTNDKRKCKELKWLLYRIIRRSLLWKGLDIYCNEDIDRILYNFPWILFFQVVARFLLEELICSERSNYEDLTVVYRVDKVEELSYKSSLISKFLHKSKSKRRITMIEETNLHPCPEYDSVIFAYSSALEKEAKKRKREEIEEVSLDGISELFQNKKQLLENEEEDEKPKIDFSNLKNNFDIMSDRLDELKRQIEENAKILKVLEGT